MRALLRPDGAILIGDVMFETRADLERCRERAGEEWDDEEIYFVADELRDAVPGAGGAGGHEEETADGAG